MAKKPSPRALRKAMDEFQVPEGVPARRGPARPPPTDEKALGLLCRRLASGLSMVDACLDPGCPSERVVYETMAADEVFGGIIARARAAQQHAIIDDTIRMADEATEENWQVVRLRIWARQWRAGQLNPRVYGRKMDVSHAGFIGTVNIPYDPSALTDEQREVMRDVLLTAPKTIDGKAE